MRVSEKQANMVALIMFAVFTVGTPLGVLRCIELLINTNQLIYLLLIIFGVYLTVVFGQCMVRFISIFD